MPTNNTRQRTFDLAVSNRERFALQNSKVELPLMTASTLRSYTCKDLAQMARREGVHGWHSMRKDELVAALVRAAKRRRAAASRSDGKSSAADAKESSASSSPRKPAAKPSPARLKVQREINALRAQQEELKNLGNQEQGAASSSDAERDRLVVMVRDPYWLHAYWEISPQNIERARTALGQNWHDSKPVLRVLRVAADGGAKVERVVEIHGGVSNWYVDVKEPPNSYRMEIGYLAAENDSFYCLSRSNTVTTPAPGSADTVDKNWADVAENADQIYAMSGGYSPNGASMELQELLEERLRRRLGRPAQIRFGNGAAGSSRNGELRLAIDAELVVYGSTDPHTHVTVKGEPVPVRPDGTFAIKMHLPDRRQVVPVVAGSSDGVEQKTVILGVERNTKMLDPVVREVAT